MGKLIFGMHLSLDGYVDGLSGNLEMPPPSPKLFSYWIETIRGHAGTVYGRRMYEVMRYWDDDHPEWTESFREFAIAWRELPKWGRFSHSPGRRSECHAHFRRYRDAGSRAQGSYGGNNQCRRPPTRRPYDQTRSDRSNTIFTCVPLSSVRVSRFSMRPDLPFACYRVSWSTTSPFIWPMSPHERDETAKPQIWTLWPRR